MRPSLAPPLAALALLLLSLVAWRSKVKVDGGVEVGVVDTADASLPPLQPSLRDVYAKNQATRASVKVWIDRAHWESPPSFFNYGLPAYALPKINLPVGGRPIGHDLVGLLGAQLQQQRAGQQERKLRYLEIGVSVGKCLMTQLQYFGPRAQTWAFDLEEINPTFAALLTPGTPALIDSWTEEQLEPGMKTLRRSSGQVHVDTIKAFSSPAGGELRYLAADEFNAIAWQRLRAHNAEPFDLIYSDALHTPDALLFEASQLLHLSLVNLQGFAIVWDDCAGSMVTQAVCPILELLRKQPGVPLVHFARYSIGGWTGINEEEHGTCIATTLNLQELRARDADLAQLLRFKGCS